RELIPCSCNRDEAVNHHRDTEITEVFSVLCVSVVYYGSRRMPDSVVDTVAGSPEMPRCARHKLERAVIVQSAAPMSTTLEVAHQFDAARAAKRVPYKVRDLSLATVG